MIANGPMRARGRMACPDCGLVQLLPPSKARQVAECGRCRCVLAGPATGRIAAPLALAVAALLLMVPACIAPLMAVSTYGAQRESWLTSSAVAFWRDGFESLALAVGLLSVALPFVFLILLIWVLGSLQFRRDESPTERSWNPRVLGALFRWTQHLRPWVMVEVFLIGCFVSYSRIQVVAAVDVEAGGWCLIAATLALLLALARLDEHTIWESLQPAEPDGPNPISCKECNLLVGETVPGQRCPRCRATLHLRKPDSIRRTTALVLAGYLLYIPANMLPVLTTVRFGREEQNTILSGVVELARNDLWPLAVIVFAASIVLPLVKLLGLTWMLISTRLRSARFLVGRTRFYRMIDTVGRWSNIDVFAVSLLLALLQFGALTTVHAGAGLVAFAAVVVLTMMATSVFDARLMWDAPESRYG